MTLLVSFFRLTFEIGIAEKESSANLPFVEIGRRGNVRADGDLNKRRIFPVKGIRPEAAIFTKRLEAVCMFLAWFILGKRDYMENFQEDWLGCHVIAKLIFVSFN